jgi:hypothetical protein
LRVREENKIYMDRQQRISLPMFRDAVEASRFLRYNLVIDEDNQVFIINFWIVNSILQATYSYLLITH